MKTPLLRTVLFAAAAIAAPRIARAGAWAERIDAAAGACRNDAAQLRALAADCRAHAEPPPDGGDYCTGITYQETTPDGEAHTYDFSPDQADEVADRFDGYAPTLDAAAKDVGELEDAADTTQTKIAALGFEKTAADYEGWMQLAESSRDQLAEESKKLLIGRAFDAAEGLADGIASLSRGRAQRMADELAHYGDAGVELGKRLKRIARIAGRRDKAEAVAGAIEALHALYDQATADGDLDALASALTEAVPAEGFGFLVDEIKWATAAAYAYEANTIVEARLDQLAELQKLQLRALQSLTKLFEKQVGRIHDAVAPLHGCSYAPPVG